MPRWTNEQSDAIYKSGENIIVSAGAGSGKTAVLSERVLEKVLSGVDVDRLLILTFTKAAANEMKRRIRNKIKEKDLSVQLNKIDNSYITTFDSYSLSLVRKYHYLLNIKPNVNIIESNILKLKVSEYLDEIMEEKYQEKSINFTKLIEDFCIKEDSEIKKAILSINDKLNMKYNKKEYLMNYLDNFYNEDRIKENINRFVSLIKEKVSEYDNLIKKLSDYSDMEYFTKVEEVSHNLINSNTYEEIKSSCNITLPRLPKNSDEVTKKVKEELNDKLKEIKGLTESDDELSLFNDIMNTKVYLEEIIEIIKKLDEKLEKYKRDNDLFDFVDISKMAIKIILENANIREEIKNYFVEIMVDEYQDTSDLQEEFISLISNNNLYMVGDIKQSIYRFRNANPDIFRNKYNHYAMHDGGIKIDLLKNFRSREEVLQNINLMFDFVMDDNIGGANYIKEHRMVFGNTTYNEEGKTTQNNDFEVYNYSYDKKGEYTEEEIEAFIIADDIINKVNSHYQVFDKDNKILRDITYDDFSILVDRSKSFELYKKIFLYKHIPLSIYKDEYLTGSSLFSCIRSIYKLLSLLKNNEHGREVKYMFLSIGRSFLFNYSDEYLFDVIRNNSYDDTEIFKITKTILENIDDKTISNILDEIIVKFNVYEKLLTIPLYYDNLVKIDYLYNLSDTLNQMGYNYQNYILFLDDIVDGDNDIKFSLNKEDSGSVKMMTIHKSKGLEYHICYFPGLTKKFNTQELKERFNYSDDLGIITPVYDDGIKATFYQELLKNAYKKDEISEKIRLFYVALTRAKEKMIFVLPLKEDDNENDQDGVISNGIRMHYNSFADILLSIKSKIASYIKKVDIASLHLSKDYNLIKNNNLFSNMQKIDEEIKVIDYPIIKPKEHDEKHFSKESIKVIKKEQKDIMDFGTKIHYFLETLDLKNPNLDDIDTFYQEKITNFLNCDLLKNINDAKVYQEYEFVEEENGIMKHGVIDLMLEYSDHFDIFDYKLKNIDDDAYTLQLNGYRDYIKKITNKDVNIYLYSIMDSIYKKL